MKKYLSWFLALLFVFCLAGCSQTDNESDNMTVPTEDNTLEGTEIKIPDNFVLIQGRKLYLSVRF